MTSPRACLLPHLLAVLITGLATVATPTLHAQAQSLLSSNQVVIARVENVNPSTILISGINFDKFEGSPVVSLSAAGSAVTVITSVYNSASKDVTATLPANVAGLPGTYRLMISFGSGTAGTDVFEFTVGAVGPKGETGDKGATGAKGDQGIQGIQGPQGATGTKGDQGIQGLQGIQGIQGPQGATGAKGDQGLQGPKGDTGATGPIGATGPVGATGAAGASGNFPVYQNWPEALKAYAATPNKGLGVVWVQASSGQVYQITAAKIAAPGN